jgi:hypothetical protein
MRLLLMKLSFVAFFLSSCSSSVTTVTSIAMSQPPITVSTTSTSTTQAPTTAVTLPRVPERPSSTPIPEPEVPRAKLAADECEYPEGSHYCIWGTEPIDLVVNNSRIAYIQQSVVQSFTAVSDQISMVEVPLQTSDIGELVLLNQALTPSASCLSVHLTTETGRRISSVYYADAGGVGRLQLVEVPLVASVQVGGRYKLEVLKEPACVPRSLAIRITTSSFWKYPKASGTLILDSQTSIGSLWARIN